MDKYKADLPLSLSIDFQPLTAIIITLALTP